ncbi:MAG: 16S rRNA (uracil(1498)-N(3))-methyltransferase [Gallionella sp.]|nr:16S rRNA (uracil(1498)-N(3))-methyltransferase [Gallionella sp.]
MRYIITPTPSFICALTMPRFYCPPPLPLSGTFDLPPDAAHHASRVLRLREGSRVEIFDGIGNECHGVVTVLSGKRVIVGDIAPCSVNRESPLQVMLAQALSSSEKMDWVIQKATELGVTEIQPLDTERSVAKLSAERAAKRLEHWQQVAISACEQCGRNVLPEIHAPLGIMAWLQQMKELPEESSAAKFILLPQGAATLHSQQKPQGKVVLLIGAEGGFTQVESDSALRCGFTPIRMGARVLRTETAAVAGLSALQTLWGDFNL